MSGLGDAIQDMEVPLLEVGTTARGLKHLALCVGQQETGIQAVLFFLAHHLELLHEHLYEKYEALLKASKEDGPKLVG